MEDCFVDELHFADVQDFSYCTNSVDISDAVGRIGVSVKCTASMVRHWQRVSGSDDVLRPAESTDQSSGRGRMRHSGTNSQCTVECRGRSVIQCMPNKRSNSHITELQLHSKQILDIKGGSGHKLYEQTSQVGCIPCTTKNDKRRFRKIKILLKSPFCFSA
jgi:hypothetical protein